MGDSMEFRDTLSKIISFLRLKGYSDEEIKVLLLEKFNNGNLHNEEIKPRTKQQNV